MRLPKNVPAALWVCLGLFVACMLFVPRFGTAANFINLGRVGAILALVAIGQGVVIVVRGLDFSVGTGVALFSVATVLCAPLVGVLPAFFVGALSVLALGVFNGMVISLLNLPAFLVTLGSMIAVHGVCSVLVGGVPLEAPVGIDLSGVARAEWLGVPASIWLAGLTFACVYVIMQFTTFGRECYLIGSNPDAARFAGIAVRLRVIQIYVLNAALVAMAGLLLTSRLGSGQPNLYPELPFEAIAACAIGGIPLNGGRGGPLNALAGAFILTLSVNALVLLNFPSYLQSVLLGILIMGSVLLQQWGTQMTRQGSRHASTMGDA